MYSAYPLVAVRVKKDPEIGDMRPDVLLSREGGDRVWEDEGGWPRRRLWATQ